MEGQNIPCQRYSQAYVPSGTELVVIITAILVSLTCLKYLGVFGFVQKMGTRKVAIAVVSIILLTGGVFAILAVGQPSGGVQDVGDWGNITEERTEIVTTLWVKNPNAIGLSSNNLRATYQIQLNGVNLAEGNKDGIDIQSGNNTIQLSTYLRNNRIEDWWVNYISSNETINVRASGEVHIGDTVTFGFPEQSRTLLENSTPVLTSLTNAARGLEGEYTKSESVGAGPTEEDVTVGYEIQRGWATWGTVNEDDTTVLFHLQIHNPGDVPVPAVPDGLGVSVDMNDIRLFRAQEDAVSPRNVEQDEVIRPGETREVVLAVTMDNDKVDNWFTSHVRRGEYSNVTVQLQLVFNIDETGTTLRVPREGGITYQCELQTGILKDGQSTSTTCGDEGSAIGGPSSQNESTEGQTATETDINRTARREVSNLYADGLEAISNGNNHFEQANQTYEPGNIDTYDQAAEEWAQAEESYGEAAENFGDAANVASRLGLTEVERICQDAQEQALLLENASRNYKLGLRAAMNGDYEESEQFFQTGRQEQQQVDTSVFVEVATLEEMLGL